MMLRMLFILLCFSQVTPFARAQSVDTTGYVQIHADPRLSLVVNKPSTSDKGFSGKRNGFRVQIYNGNDRKKASQVKVDFMRQYPGVRSYLVYTSPQFRVRVGDFTTRAAAMEFYNKVSSSFSPCMIVPDVVNVSSARNNKERNKEGNSDSND